MELLKLRDAARMLNISYPTLKQWIYRGKLRSIKTPGGHHRIAQSEIVRCLTRARLLYGVVMATPRIAEGNA